MKKKEEAEDLGGEVRRGEKEEEEGGREKKKKKKKEEEEEEEDKKNCVERRKSRSLLRDLSPTLKLNWPGNNRVQIKCNTSGAHHVQHFVLRATWYEGTAQLLSLTEFKLHLFLLYFVV